MNKGIVYAAGAYLMWGAFPIYFKALHGVGAVQVVAHRIIWSFLFLLLVVALKKELPALWAAARPRTLLIYLVASLLLAINWLTYVYGVSTDHVLETSLGYFINPLVSVLLGVVFLRERLRPAQWIPVGLALVGVAYLTYSFGSLPWIALALAFSFGLYGLAKKVSPLGSLHGVMMETTMIFLPALIYVLVLEARGEGNFVSSGPTVTLLLAVSGIITAVPLLLFATGARRVPLSTLGLLQYISPTCQFIMGVFLFHEPFNSHLLIGFGIIWLALAIFTAETFVERRQSALRAANFGGADPAPEIK